MQKVIIIGAGRSGTNMLRDIIEKFPGITTWDCDEINPVWRHGNATHPTDELKTAQISKGTRRAVDRAFNKQSRRGRANIVLEKTCANSLRVPFVYELCPDAKYIFIFRDGRDVVPSAMKRWVSKLDLSYTLKKMKYVPGIDFPYYLFKFGFNRLKRIFVGKDQLSFWGPIYEGMDDDVQSLSLAEVCAKQWSKCVINSLEGLKVIPSDQVYKVHYESFVQDPKHYASEIAKFIDLSEELNEDTLTKAVEGVSTRSVGSYKRNLTESDLFAIQKICEDAMIKSGYSYE